MDKKQKFDFLFNKSKKELFKIAKSVTNNTEQAEDALQDAYLKAWKHFDNFDSSKKFENWMITIVRNTSIDSNRSRARKDIAVPFSVLSDRQKQRKVYYELEDKSSNLNHMFEKTSKVDDLYDLIEALPKDLKEIMVRYASGDSYDEISQENNLPIATITAKVHRAKKIMRKNSKNLPNRQLFHVQ
jgi:RNA polymerase sigma-70 factor (ECF subfamily)